ncbi:Phosphoenolpyruvate guanylyltransferase [Paraconexibacter sp. AEG42_29]|uniref:Phosphoenolpyruvate guanylyltransferase n=1 Tax=Paraconexibacter sp. AEG42_29 TaxID=2997339 RepID=A0AAU7AUD8_9ACTN
MTTFAILPVKHFAGGKTRLADDLGTGTRRALVEAMVTDVLIALRRAEKIDQTLVVTGEAAMEAIAHGYDASTVMDPDDAGHSEAALLGIAEALERGARRVLLVPGDCPALDPKEVDALLTRAPAPTPEVVVIPDRHGEGTNGLVLTPPDIIVPSFGPGSYARHVDAARAAGAVCRTEELPSLVLDVDTIHDLAALREALGGGHGNAAHTRGMLNRLARR